MIKIKKKRTSYVKAGAFYTVQGIFWVFHACDSHMYQSTLFKNGTKFPYFLYFLCAFLSFFCFFCPFQPYFTLYRKNRALDFMP